MFSFNVLGLVVYSIFMMSGGAAIVLLVLAILAGGNR